MKNKRIWMLAAILALCGTMTCINCTAHDDKSSGQEAQAELIPLAPDYADPTMWITADGDTEGTGADVFYVVSTWEEDWQDGNG